MIKYYILTILLISSFCKYENSNTKKFLSKIGLPDIPTAHQYINGISILEEQSTDEETVKYVNVKCLWANKRNVYSLQKLQSEKDYVKEFEEGKIIFNFCTNIKSEVETTAIWEKDILPNETEIIKLSGSINGEGKSTNEWSEFEDDDESKGIKIKMTKGEKCLEDSYHQTYFKVYCDPDVEDSEFLNTITFEGFRNDTCTHYINARSIYGCALNEMYLLKRFMEEYKYCCVVVFVLVGLFLCLFGKKYQTITIVVFFGILLMYIATVIVLNLIPNLITSEKNLWYLLVFSFIAGGIIGVFLKAKVKLVAILIGASMGYSFSEFVYQIIQNNIDLNPTAIYYGTMGVCIIIGVLLAIKVVEAIIIVGTSIIGGYIVMRGVAIVGGEYWDEEQFADMVKSQEMDQLKEMQSNWIYAYLGLWLIVSAFGIWFQCFRHKKQKSSEPATNKNVDIDYQKQK